MAGKDEKKKGLFGRAFDRLSDKDEKEALAEAETQLEAAKDQVEKEAAQKRIAELKASQAERAKQMAQDKAESAEARAQKSEEKLRKMEAEMRGMKANERKESAQKMREMVQKQRAEKEAEEARKTWKTHVVKQDETLGHIALKYYGSAVKDKWMVIYNANKDVIGDNPNVIRPGMELSIPEIES